MERKVLGLEYTGSSRGRVSQLGGKSILPCSDTQILGLLAKAQALVTLPHFKLQLSFGLRL